MRKKITFEAVMKIGMEFPGVEKSTAYGAPSLKVGGRLLTCPALNKSAEPDSLVVRVSFDQRDGLLADAPDTYYVTDHYINHPAVLVRMHRIEPDGLRDLLRMAWRFVTAEARDGRRQSRRKAR